MVFIHTKQTVVKLYPNSEKEFYLSITREFLENAITFVKAKLKSPMSFFY